MKWKFEKEFREAHPETIGETDSHYDLDNYKDWLEQQLVSKNDLLQRVNHSTIEKPSRYRLFLYGWEIKFTRKNPHNCNHRFRKQNIKWQPIFE